jgi:hypothetical protein
LLAVGEAETAAGRAAELEAELAQQKELVGRLEEDLLAADNAGGGGSGGAGAGGSDAMAAAAGGQLAGGGGSGELGGGSGGEQTMVAVLCSQRDRFRARAQEVEQHLATLGQELKKVQRGAFCCSRRICHWNASPLLPPRPRCC